MSLCIKKKKVFVAGHNGLAGSAIVRRLKREDCNVVTVEKKIVNLLNRNQINKFFQREKPEIVINAAGKVGGIAANINYPLDFIQDNITIQDNIFRASYDIKVRKLIFLGSSCIYPYDCKQPIKEEYLMKGDLEKSNEYYALAKIAGIKTCEAYNKQFNCDFITVMPTNLYGANDNFNPETSHVPAALVNKFHYAKVHDLKNVVIWGDGIPYREFMHADDFADACIFILKKYKKKEIINIGTGEDISIKDFALLIMNVIGYKGKIVFDKNKPSGIKKKLLDISKLKKMGWRPKFRLKNGIKDYYKWYLENLDKLRK